MTEMIERCGMAVHEAIMRLGGTEGAGVPDYEMIARAVIEAMREPTDAMVKAAMWEDGEQTARTVWREMIDSTLNGGGRGE